MGGKMERASGASPPDIGKTREYAQNPLLNIPPGEEFNVTYGTLFARSALVAFAMTVGANTSFADGKIALVVGNANYKKIDKLESATKRSDAVAGALAKIGFEVIARKDADKANMDRALSEFARKSAGSRAALFYFAGHAVSYRDHDYFLPTGIEVEDFNDIEFSAIDVGRAIDAMSRSDGIKIVVYSSPGYVPLQKRPPNCDPGRRVENLAFVCGLDHELAAKGGAGPDDSFTSSFVGQLSGSGLDVEALFGRVARDVVAKGGRPPDVSMELSRRFNLDKPD